MAFGATRLSGEQVSDDAEVLSLRALQKRNLLATLFRRRRVQPFPRKFRHQDYWSPIVYVHHPAGAVGGDDDESVMFPVLFVRIRQLPDRGTEGRGPISTSDEIGLLLRPAFVDPVKPPINRREYPVRPDGPEERAVCHFLGTRALAPGQQQVSAAHAHRPEPAARRP